MNRITNLIAAICLPFFALCQPQQDIKPVIPGDFADPSIISDGSTYYAVGTSSEWAPHFPIYSSKNMTDWKQVGYVFDKAPDWTVGSFWAPEYYFMNNKYYIYYTARRKKDNISCIGVAVSDYPDHGFVDKGIVVDYGKEAIDAFITNDDGQLYISFKAYGLDKRPIEILAKKLSADGLSTIGDAFSLLKDDDRVGIEGQAFIKKDGYYYLFFSAGNCCGLKCDYNVQVARSKKYSGPYERFSTKPILYENSQWKCSGHGTFVQDTENNYFYLYHAYNKLSTVYSGRQALLAELTFTGRDGWPVFSTPSNGSSTSKKNITDAFNATSLAPHWQWDWRNSSPSIMQANGKLRLSGTVKENNETGIVLTVRPAAAAFEMSVQLPDETAASQGLAYYGDAGAALGMARTGTQLTIWTNRNKQFSNIATKSLNNSDPLELKLSVDTNHICRFYYRQSTEWIELTTAQPVSADFLPQWDRSPRPGLYFKGTPDQWASFSNFSFSYL